MLPSDNKHKESSRYFHEITTSPNHAWYLRACRQFIHHTKICTRNAVRAAGKYAEMLE